MNLDGLEGGAFVKSLVIRRVRRRWLDFSILITLSPSPLYTEDDAVTKFRA